jgi:uncharacterized membrane protein YbhN (UPF0104 family)
MKRALGNSLPATDGTGQSARRHQSTLFAFLRGLLAVTILAYLASSGVINWSRLQGMVDAWRYTLVALTLLVIGFGLASWRACALFTPRGLRLTFANSLRLTFVGNAANLILPLIGSDMVRIVFTSRGQVGRKTEIATVILLERMLGLIGILALPVVAAPFFARFIAQHSIILWTVLLSGAGALALILPMMAALSRRVRGSGVVRLLLRRFPVRGIPERILDTLQGYRHAPTILIRALALSIAINSVLALAIMLLYAAMHPGALQPITAFLASLGAVSNNFPLTPGGIGVAEAAFESIFRTAGLSGGAEALIGSRLLFLVLAPAGAWIYVSGVRPIVSKSASADLTSADASHPENLHKGEQSVFVFSPMAAETPGNR